MNVLGGEDNHPPPAVALGAVIYNEHNKKIYKNKSDGCEPGIEPDGGLCGLLANCYDELNVRWN